MTTTGSKPVVFSINQFEVELKEKPVENHANKRLAALIAAHLGVPPSRVRITKGHHSPLQNPHHLLIVDKRSVIR